MTTTVPQGMQCEIGSNGVIYCGNAQIRPRIVPSGGNSNGNVTVSTNPVTGQIQISQNPNAIQQWIDAALSGLAIWRGAAYVPTTTPPTANQPQIIYQTNPNGTGGFNNTGDSIGIDSFIQNNKGVLLIGGVALALLFMKPPTRR